MFKVARRLGYEVACVDENSDAGWLQEATGTVALIHQANIENMPGHHGMGKCRRQAFQKASNIGRPLMTWLDPQKNLWVLDNTHKSPIALAATPVYNRQADIVIPRRQDNNQSYPLLQQFSEIEGNLVTMSILRNRYEKLSASQEDIDRKSSYIDHYSGPKIFRTENVKYFTLYSGEINGKPADRWHAVHMPPFQMLFDGLNLKGVAVPYTQPIKLSEIEARDHSMDLKRIEQLADLTKAVKEFSEQDLSSRLQKT